MAFQASKQRVRRASDPVGVGLQLIPSAAVRVWYQQQMRAIMTSMLEDYKTELDKAFKVPEVRQHFGMDERVMLYDARKPFSIFDRIMKWLDDKWKDIFTGFASVTSNRFADKVDQHSKATMWNSLTTAGIREPKKTYNDNIRSTLGTAVEFNHTLITGLQQDAHERIHKAIMLSLVSPNPDEQGQAGIASVLYKEGITQGKRIKLIARDQNSKMYAALNNDRMAQNGVEKFKWVHSGAGVVPRPSHEKMDEHIFEIDDPRLWKTGGEFGLKSSDLGPPGWAINCRCRAVPVILSDDY